MFNPLFLYSLFLSRRWSWVLARTMQRRVLSSSLPQCSAHTPPDLEQHQSTCAFVLKTKENHRPWEKLRRKINSGEGKRGPYMGQMSWCMPSIPALGRQRQANLWVWGQPCLNNEFHVNYSYAVRSCLKQRKKRPPTLMSCRLYNV